MHYEAAVVDRIVGGSQVVLLVGEEERQYVVDRSHLPDGIREGLWLRVAFEGGILVHAQIDSEATKAAERRIAAKLQQLRQRGRPRE